MLLQSLLVVIIILLIWVLLSQRSKDEPPGPLRLPLLGHAHLFKGPKLFELLEMMYRKYGPITAIKLGRRNIVFVSSPELVHEVLEANGYKCNSRLVFDAGLIYDGVPEQEAANPNSTEVRHGVATSSGELWRQSRKLVFVKLLTKAKVHRFENVVRNELEEFVTHLRHKAVAGESIDMNNELPKSTMNAIAAMAFGMRIHMFDKSDQYAEKMSELVKFLFQYFTPFNPEVSIKFLRLLPGSRYKKFVQCMKDLRAMLTEILEKHESELGNLSDDDDTLLDAMLRARTDSEYNEIGNRAIVTTMVDLLLAGTDTTSMSASFVLRQLINRPELQARVHEELDRVVGRDRRPTYADVEKLQLLDAVVLESQRLFPVAPGTLPHIVTEDFTVQGYTIKKGTTVIGSIYATHRDPSAWNDPTAFKPERWLVDPSLKNSSYFWPFGTGPRVCLGRYLAVVELQLLLAYLLQSFRFTSPDGPIPEEQVLGLTLTPIKYFALATARDK